MRFVSLFSGIGGLDLGLERAGHECVLQVEIDDYCQRVLAKHWPDVKRIADVKDVTADDCKEADAIVGGFPCQPVSVAGRREAQADPRWLWPQFARLISEVRPRYVVVENVPGLLTTGMGEVLGDLSALGYDADWGRISAEAVGAPHLRWRIFVVAYAGSERIRFQQGWGGGASGEDPLLTTRDGTDGTMADATGQRLEGAEQQSRGEQRTRTGSGSTLADANGESSFWPPVARQERTSWSVEPDIRRVAHGVPKRVDRLRALGNAVVPQVAEYIGGMPPMAKGRA